MQKAEMASGVSAMAMETNTTFLDRWIINPELHFVESAYDMRIPFVVVSFYVVFVKWFGPMLMSGRKPFSLKNVLIAYNALIVSANAYCCFQAARHCVNYYFAHCRMMEHPQFPNFKQLIFRTAWAYHLSKYVDLADTVLFVLRKKYSQVSFLHVFHHAAVIFISAHPMRDRKYGYYVPYVIMLNSFVHVLTYSYYSLSTLGYNLWWKRYLTIAQIVQFIFLLSYMGHAWWTACEHLGGSQLLITLFLVSLFLLFIHYYISNFGKSKPE